MKEKEEEEEDKYDARSCAPLCAACTADPNSHMPGALLSQYLLKAINRIVVGRRHS